jgi:hypothetical protein
LNAFIDGSLMMMRGRLIVTEMFCWFPCTEFMVLPLMVTLREDDEDDMNTEVGG